METKIHLLNIYNNSFTVDMIELIFYYSPLLQNFLTAVRFLHGFSTHIFGVTNIIYVGIIIISRK